MKTKIVILALFFSTQAYAGGAGGSWGEPTQPTTTGDYSGGGGGFGGGGAGGSWSDNSSTTTSGSSCSPDGWKFEYIVLKDRKSFNSLEQACRYVWSNSFLNKYGLKETRMSGGNMRGKYYRKIKVISDWSATCYVNTGYKDTNYDNNIGGSIDGYDVSKYYVGKVEICDPETMPPIPNFPMPPAPNAPSGGNGGGSGNGGGNGNGGNTNNYNYTTNNYDWDITTNNTTNNTNHITNNHGISDDKINQLIIAIKNQNHDVDLTNVINAINSVNNSINNLSFEQIKSIEVDLTAVINAINANKYDDTQLKQKIDEITKAINDKQIDLNEVTKRQDETNTKLDDANNKADEQTGLLTEIRDLLKPTQTLQADFSSPDFDPSLDPWSAIRGFDIHQNLIQAQAQCPSAENYSFDFFGVHYVMPIDILCSFFAKLGPAVLFLAYMTGAFIVVKGD